MEKINVRSATPEERLYCEMQSSQIAGQTGWMPSDSPNKDFQEALQTVITWENGLNAADFCTEHSEAKDKNGAYKFRANVGDYTFMISLFPEAPPGLQTDTLCYETLWLDRHIDHAGNGIRIIDAKDNYHTKFCLRDGGKIYEAHTDGQSYLSTLRYVDDYHFQRGRFLYHVREYAELCQRNGIFVSAYEEDKIPVGRIDIFKSDDKEIVESKQYTNVDDFLQGIEDCDRNGKKCTVAVYQDDNCLRYQNDRPDVRIPLEKYDPERIHFVREHLPKPTEDNQPQKPKHRERGEAR